MKASLSLALSYHPELIIVDEPTASSIFRGVKQASLSLYVATHQLLVGYLSPSRKKIYTYL